MAETVAQKNRRIRQEALREQLSKQKLVEKVLDNIKEMEKLDPADETAKTRLDILKAANADRARLINKYLPDLRHTELSTDPEEPFTITISSKDSAL